MQPKQALLLLLLVATAHAARPDGPTPSPARSPTTDGLLVPPLRFPKGPDLEQLRAGDRGAPAGPPTETSLMARKAAVEGADTRFPSRAAAAKVSEAAPPSSSTTPSSGTPSTASSAKNSTSVTSTAFVEPNKSAGILVGLFVAVAVLGYAGLLVWRRVLERRYGTREILVNEDQFEQERDLSNFQL